MINILKRVFSQRKVPLPLIKQLREVTQSPYNLVLKALQECNNDKSKAIQWLKTKGIADSLKKQSHQTKNGVISIKVSQNRDSFAMIQVNCETDFVAKSDIFLEYVNKLNTALLNINKDTQSTQILSQLKNQQESITNFNQAKQIASAKLKQNIVISKLIKQSSSKKRYGHYVHSCFRTGIGLKGSIISFQTDCQQISTVQQVGDNLALQILGLKPQYFKESDVAQQIKKKWQQEIKQEMKDKFSKSKPQVIDKIIKGKLKKTFYQDKILEYMGYVLDPHGKKTVGEYLKQTGINIKIIDKLLWQI